MSAKDEAIDVGLGSVTKVWYGIVAEVEKLCSQPLTGLREEVS